MNSNEYTYNYNYIQSCGFVRVLIPTDIIKEIKLIINTSKLAWDKFTKYKLLHNPRIAAKDSDIIRLFFTDVYLIRHEITDGYFDITNFSDIFDKLMALADVGLKIDGRVEVFVDAVTAQDYYDVLEYITELNHPPQSTNLLALH